MVVAPNTVRFGLENVSDYWQTVVAGASGGIGQVSNHFPAEQGAFQPWCALSMSLDINSASRVPG
jgi:hypothetical protein